jgi:hexosaminidase
MPLCLLVAVFLPMLATKVIAQSSSPAVVPALQEWNDSPGAFRLTGQSRIVVADPALLATAQTLARDVFDLRGAEIVIVTAASPVAGDISLQLDSALSVPNWEGYAISVGDTVVIRGPAISGVFYGTRTLLQLLHQDFSISAGSGRDWPEYPERGFMLDVGEKFFTLDFLKRQVRDMSYLKMNMFHLHLSQDGGFRLESESHPEVVSPDHYSKQDMLDLQALAREYHMLIVPEIDIPAHATAMLASHPELQLPGHPDMLDLSQPGSYTLVQDLLEEYLPLFEGPYWHSGGDEYLQDSDYAQLPQYTAYAQQRYGPSANGQDLYVGLANWMDGIVKQHHKQLRSWNDFLTVTPAVNRLNPDVVLEVWSRLSGAMAALNNGNKVNNGNPDYLYYVTGDPSFPSDPKQIYEIWTPSLFRFDEAIPPSTSALVGSQFDVWCDHPEAETPDQIEDHIFDRLRSFGQKSWGSPQPFSTFADFQATATKIGRTPGWLPDFFVATSASRLIVAQNQPAVMGVSVSANSTFSGVVGVSCSTTLPNSVCQISASHIALLPFQKEIVSIMVKNSQLASNGRLPKGLEIGWETGLIGMLMVSGRRTRRRRLPMLVVLAASMLFQVGCGGTQKSSSGNQNSSVTVTFTSGSVTHSVAVGLTSGN